MTLTLAEVAANPEAVTYDVTLSSGEALTLRPLGHGDVKQLGAFLHSLSPQTRRFSLFPSYDEVTARALCDAINRYDKLRFVLARPLEPNHPEIVGLFEFSFDISPGDLERYARYGMMLDARVDCRFGPTLADHYQNQGVGSCVFPHLVDVARNFGKTRMVLWGGVLADNARAIRFYTKQGFRQVGEFVDHEEENLLDMILDVDAVGE